MAMREINRQKVNYNILSQMGKRVELQSQGYKLERTDRLNLLIEC